MTREHTKRMLDLFCAFEGIEPSYRENTLDVIHSLIQAHIKIDEYEQGVNELVQEVDEFLDRLKNMKEGAS